MECKNCKHFKEEKQMDMTNELTGGCLSGNCDIDQINCGPDGSCGNGKFERK